MDFVAELFLEILGEAIIEGGVDAAVNHRLPKWLRVLTLAVLGLLFTAVFAVILLAGVGAFRELPLISLFLFALDAVFVFVTGRKLRKILRTFSRI